MRPPRLACRRLSFHGARQPRLWGSLRLSRVSPLAAPLFWHECTWLGMAKVPARLPRMSYSGWRGLVANLMTL
jgi:hypothetical protein